MGVNSTWDSENSRVGTNRTGFIGWTDSAEECQKKCYNDVECKSIVLSTHEKLGCLLKTATADNAGMDDSDQPRFRQDSYWDYYEPNLGKRFHSINTSILELRSHSLQASFIIKLTVIDRWYHYDFAGIRLIALVLYYEILGGFYGKKLDFMSNILVVYEELQVSLLAFQIG